MDDDRAPASRLDRARYSLVFEDDFSGSVLDPDRWLDHYLPQWSTPDRSAARYRLEDGGLRLLIEADQPAWRPEDGELRVSHLQTGSFSGPLGSSVGQHRHRRDLTVRTPQPTRRLFTPTSGLVEVTAAASPDDTCMLGLWLVGFEERPEQSGEICIAELFGHLIGAHGSRVRLGVKSHWDPRLTTDIVDLPLDIDATELHSYAAAWDARRVLFYVDDALVRVVEQGTDYPLQLMVDLFEFPETAERPPGRYPKSAQVRRVRGYEFATGTDGRA